MASLQAKLEAEVKVLRDMQVELSNNQNSRAQYAAQLKENELVKQGTCKIIFSITVVVERSPLNFSLQNFSWWNRAQMCIN